MTGIVRRLRLVVVLMMAVVFALSVGCAERMEDASDDSVPFRDVNSPLPDINAFSATEYEDSIYMFPPIQSAVYVHDGVREPVAPDDLRLIRLLNSMNFSYAQGYTAWRQGHVEETEFFSLVDSGKPMLDICFQVSETAEINNEFSSAPRVIISANRYLLLVDSGKSTWMPDGSIYANEHFPYAELLCNYYSDLTDEEVAEIFGDVAWGDNKWIDLLAYAGFN